MNSSTVVEGAGCEAGASTAINQLIRVAAVMEDERDGTGDVEGSFVDEVSPALAEGTAASGAR